MATEEIIKMDISGKNVLIIGIPSSGKTWLCDKLSHANHKVIHTDDYKIYGFEDALYEVMADVSCSLNPTIVEGILGYRMLRKGLELNSYFPDIVIELSINHKKMLGIYAKERTGKQAKYLTGFNASNQNILNKYFSDCPPELLPEWVKVHNDY